MTKVGIIAEYNPFHNGHRYMLDEIRNRIDDPIIVAAMSGSFTQRGEPAVLNKFIRAQAAVNGGADLVVELPFLYAVRSAQDFARGGIKILSSMGIEKLAFGSEIDDLKSIKEIADRIDSDEVRSRLRAKLSEGQSYARALREALGTTLIEQPNAMLAVEYLRALRSTAIEPLLIERRGADHDDRSVNGTIASASAIRAELSSNAPDWSVVSRVIDEETLKALRAFPPPSLKKLFLPLVMRIIMSSTEELRSICGMVEGLEHKLIRAARSTSTFDELIGSMVSRRYTRSRLQRLAIHVMMCLTTDLVREFDGEVYIRPLAFNEWGRKLLRAIKGSVPIVTKAAQHLTTRAMYGRLSTLEKYQQMLALDVRATDLRELLCPKSTPGMDFWFNRKE